MKAYEWKYGVLRDRNTRAKVCQLRKVEGVFLLEFEKPIGGAHLAEYMKGPFKTEIEASPYGLELAAKHF